MVKTILCFTGNYVSKIVFCEDKDVNDRIDSSTARRHAQRFRRGTCHSQLVGHPTGLEIPKMKIKRISKMHFV